MIDVVYTGDLRSTKSVCEQNHKMFFDELDKVAKYRVHDFTVPNLADIISSPGEKDFTPCPFDRGGKDQYWVRPYHRRGEGGGVQVWQFMNAVELTENPFIIRMRPDLWFTKDSIDVIIKELKLILNGDYNIAFFGSNWLEGGIGCYHEKIELSKAGEIEVPQRTEDFLIIARRDGLKSYKETIDGLIALGDANGTRSGNKCFRYIIPKHSQAFKHLCQLYLLRTTYNKGYPTDKQVCYDYLMSYCKSEYEEGKMKPAFDWHRGKKWD